MAHSIVFMYLGFSSGPQFTVTIGAGLLLPSLLKLPLNSSNERIRFISCRWCKVLDWLYLALLIAIYIGPNYVTASLEYVFSLTSMASTTDGINLCIRATVKSWSGRRTSCFICIKIGTCLFAAGSPNATFALSSWEWGVPSFGLTHFYNALIVARRKFVAWSLKCWLFWVQKCLTEAIATCRSPYLVWIFFGIKRR